MVAADPGAQAGTSAPGSLGRRLLSEASNSAHAAASELTQQLRGLFEASEQEELGGMLQTVHRHLLVSTPSWLKTICDEAIAETRNASRC